MHVAFPELTRTQRGPLLMRSATLDDAAFVFVETPDTGTPGTSLEEFCDQPHWAVVLRGPLTLELGRERIELLPGSAFHVPAGRPAHRIFADRRILIAGFVPLRREPDGETAGHHTTSDRPGVDLGLLTANGLATEDQGRVSVVAPATRSREPLADGEIAADSVLMGRWIFTAARFQRNTGYTRSWCDLPHYGLVLDGAIALEGEDEVEVAERGDVYACAAGPPGHRIEVTDTASIVDFTPLDTTLEARRVSDWRPRIAEPRTRARPIGQPAG